MMSARWFSISLTLLLLVSGCGDTDLIAPVSPSSSGGPSTDGDGVISDSDGDSPDADDVSSDSDGDTSDGDDVNSDSDGDTSDGDDVRSDSDGSPSTDSDAPCESDDDCSDWQRCDVESGECVGAWDTVVIVSETTVVADILSPNPGPDIDAVELIRGEDRWWADEVVFARMAKPRGAIDNNCVVPESVLGEPRSFPSTEDNGECLISDSDAEGRERYFCLGSGYAREPGLEEDIEAQIAPLREIPGQVAVRFSEAGAIEPGDIIRVYEMAPPYSGGTEIGCRRIVDRNDGYSVLLANELSEREEPASDAMGWEEGGPFGRLVTGRRLLADVAHQAGYRFVGTVDGLGGVHSLVLDEERFASRGHRTCETEGDHCQSPLDDSALLRCDLLTRQCTPRCSQNAECNPSARCLPSSPGYPDRDDELGSNGVCREDLCDGDWFESDCPEDAHCALSAWSGFSLRACVPSGLTEEGAYCFNSRACGPGMACILNTCRFTCAPGGVMCDDAEGNFAPNASETCAALRVAEEEVHRPSSPDDVETPFGICGLACDDTPVWQEPALDAAWLPRAGCGGGSCVGPLVAFGGESPSMIPLPSVDLVPADGLHGSDPTPEPGMQGLCITPSQDRRLEAFESCNPSSTTTCGPGLLCVGPGYRNVFEASQREFVTSPFCAQPCRIDDDCESLQCRTMPNQLVPGLGATDHSFGFCVQPWE